MSLIWPTKEPSEVLDYTWNIVVDEGDAISTATLELVCGAAVIDSQVLNGSAITAFVSGGTWGEETVFRGIVTTTGGRTLEEIIILPIGASLPATMSKRALIGQAYTECALNGWEYDISPEEMDKALVRLDMLAADLNGRGINIGYNAPYAIGQGDLDDDLGCPDQAVFGLAVLMAQRLCPTMGKKMSQESRETLNAAMKSLRASTPKLIPSMCLARGTPLGSGNRWWSLGGRYSR